jgi:DNA transposition AAA+ family ATPase
MELNNLNTPEDVREALRQFMIVNNISQAEVGRKIGKSDSTVSQFLAGKYKGNVTEVTTDIIGLLTREHNRKLENVDIPIVMTENIRDVLATCSIVHQTKVMGLLHAQSGFGKTTGLKLYMEKHNQSVMLTAYAGITCGSLMAMLLDSLKPKTKKSYYRYQGLMMTEIIDELRGKDTLIIIDEAHFLQLKHFERIRAIHDATECPVIYSGNDEIVDRMTGAQQFDYDRIYSRVPVKRCLNGKITRSDIQKILEALKVKETREIMKFLEKKVNEQGHYRLLKNLLANSIRFARKDGNELNMDHLQAAEQLLLGPRYSALANAN